jgi:protein tyrosine phosphatase
MIITVDHNRVKLINRENIPGDSNSSDYINANRILPEEKFGKTYLATQGPLPNTMNDFWHMVWQEKCQIILMITHEEEKGRVRKLISIHKEC